MPPMCTPEKNKEDVINQDKIDEHYFMPREESLTDCEYDDKDDEEAKNRMDKVLKMFPDLKKNFELHGQVGEGTFSTVYVASLKQDRTARRFAIKHIVPTCHPDRIKFELECLKKIGGVDNVAGIDLCLRNNNDVLLIMPYQRHDVFADYVGQIDAHECAVYMKNLLKALARVHKFGIIHRDVKPSNFLYDRLNKRYLLVDFGLAQKQTVTPEESKPQPVKQITSGIKRKRDPLSPLNGVCQEKKRPFLITPSANAIKFEPPRTDARVSCQKENDLTTSKKPTDSVPKVANGVSFVKMEKSPETKKVKTSQSCSCYGKAQICNTCGLCNPMQASRAGTPGFRPPEVLLKYPHQTTAVDVWAAGIMMLSIMSNCTNFFSCPNDIAALLELITIFGHDKMKKIANKFGRYLLCSEKKVPLDLRKICCTLRSRGEQMQSHLKGEKCTSCEQYVQVCLCPNVPLHKSIVDDFPETAYDLLHRLLDLNPKTRITAEEALNHPFLLKV